jgi:alanine-synthesizing transaminase
VLINGLHKAGRNIPSPPATMFAWAPFPLNFMNLRALKFTRLLAKEAKVLVFPELGFGEYFEAHLRIVPCENLHRIRQVICRIKGFSGSIEKAELTDAAR